MDDGGQGVARDCALLHWQRRLSAECAARPARVLAARQSVQGDCHVIL